MDSTKDWRIVYGDIDFSRFTPEQQVELQKGKDAGLPYQLYAQKDWSAAEMAQYREVLARTALCKESVKEVYERESSVAGFKNAFNFKNHPDLVCYVPENWSVSTDGKGWTGNDILLLCGGDVAKAEQVFDLCGWQSPETVLDELEREEAEEMDFPEPIKKVGVYSAEGIRPEVVEAITTRLQVIDEVAAEIKGKDLAADDPAYSSWTNLEDKLVAFLSGVNAAIGTHARYCTHLSGATVDFHDEQDNIIFSIDRHGVIGREEQQMFVFDDELQVFDDACCCVDGYLWATEPLVTRLKNQLNLSAEQKDAMDNINFYALYDLSSKEIKVDGTYYLPGAETSAPEVQHEFTLSLFPDERKELISKLENYCLKQCGVSPETLVNNIRESEGLPPLGKPDLSSIIQNAENRKEQIPSSPVSSNRSAPFRA